MRETSENEATKLREEQELRREREEEIQEAGLRAELFPQEDGEDRGVAEPVSAEHGHLSIATLR